MPNSALRIERHLQDQVGDLGKVKGLRWKDGRTRIKVACRICRDAKGAAWTSNKYLSPFERPDLYDKAVALARWVNHLEYRHDEVTTDLAPCVTFEWLHEQCDREHEYDDAVRAAHAEEKAWIARDVATSTG